MTLYQIQVYMREEKDLGSGRVKVDSIAEAKVMQTQLARTAARTINMIKEWIRGNQARRSIRKHPNTK